MFGTDIPGLSDVDMKGICIESPRILLGHTGFELSKFRKGPHGETIPEGHKTPAGSIEGQIFTLKRWTKLACKGDFSIIPMLYTPSWQRHVETPFSDRIIGARETFLSKGIAAPALGYGNSQLRTLQNSGDSYDVKAAYHALRIPYQAKELLEDHHLTLPIPNGMRDYLFSVRKGLVELNDALAMLQDLLAGLHRAASATTLPDSVDMSAIDEWLHTMYMDYWKEREWLS